MLPSIFLQISISLSWSDTTRPFLLCEPAKVTIVILSLQVAYPTNYLLKSLCTLFRLLPHFHYLFADCECVVCFWALFISILVFELHLVFSTFSPTYHILNVLSFFSQKSQIYPGWTCSRCTHPVYMPLYSACHARYMSFYDHDVTTFFKVDHVTVLSLQRCIGTLLDILLAVFIFASIAAPNHIISSIHWHLYLFKIVEFKIISSSVLW